MALLSRDEATLDFANHKIRSANGILPGRSAFLMTRREMSADAAIQRAQRRVGGEVSRRAVELLSPYRAPAASSL